MNLGLAITILLLLLSFGAHAESVKLDLYGNYKSGEVSVYIKNSGDTPVTISGLFGLTSKKGPLIIVLKDKQGIEHNIQGVVDGITTKDVYLTKGFIFGKSIKTSSMKLYYGVSKGQYFLKAKYLMRPSSDSEILQVESDWIEIYID